MHQDGGIYLKDLCIIFNKVPKYIRMLAPKGSLEVHEEAWNAYPYCRTVITNPGYMKENFYIVIETLHLPDVGNKDNVHQLPEERLKMREIVHIDIAHDPVTSADFKPDEDPQKFRSQKTGRGPLTSRNWRNEVDPVMTCYKLVTAEFKWFGFQGKVESFIQKSERRLFTNFHRQVFCWMDRWHGLTMEDIREIEEQTRRELDQVCTQTSKKFNHDAIA
ncbi:hypothetical protein B566_EDAN007324 [Ephemera danica]|nr:hypothetical protein B566_EDAN007324 [Ephemera danica]